MKDVNGGELSEENGAVIRAINHKWLHRLPLEKQAEINELFQRYKQKFYEECEVEYVEDLELTAEIRAFEFIIERQRELQEDLREEFNERNFGGYGGR